MGYVDEATAREMLALGLAALWRSHGERWLRKDDQRAQKRRIEEGFDPQWMLAKRVPSPFEIFAARERCELLKGLLGQLTRRQRRVVRMRYRNDLTFAAIGRAMRITEAAAFTLHRRTLDELKARLGTMGIRSMDDI